MRTKAHAEPFNLQLNYLSKKVNNKHIEDVDTFTGPTLPNFQ